MKHKESIRRTNTFKKNLDESNHKPNKVWVDKGSELYNRSIKSWSQDNDIGKYSTHNKRKSVIGERFIRTLKNKIYKYMNAVSKNVYIDKSAGIVNEYNNTYHRKFKKKPINVSSSTYIDFGKKIIKKIEVGVENVGTFL